MADEDYGDDDAFYFDDDDYLYVEDDYAIAVSPYPFPQPALRQTQVFETGSFPALGKLHIAPTRLSNNKHKKTLVARGMTHAEELTLLLSNRTN